MSHIIYLDPTSPEDQFIKNTKLFEISLINSEIKPFRQLNQLISHISITGASELDVHYPYVAIINDLSFTPQEKQTRPLKDISNSPLNTLLFDDIQLLLAHHYKHLDFLIFKLSQFSITIVNDEIESYHRILKNRIVRMKSWIGLNNEHATRCPCLHSMTNCLNIILQNDFEKSSKLRNFVLLINNEIDFLKLLELPRSKDYYLYCIGNWGFIAHELTCDELTFCALSIFKIAFSILDDDSNLKLSDNSILSFLFSLRDSYRGGNAFHNFRHAVDVLQASFYILICLNALPKFPHFTSDYNLNPNNQESEKSFFQNNNFIIQNALLHPVQTLALLVSSVGHDVGHPGLTNPFLINHKSPIAKIYSNKSVLENYHSTIFQDILSNHWPLFLENSFTQDPKHCLNTKIMQVESIIATDMADHFEHVSKIHEIGSLISSTEQRLAIKNSLKQTNVILSLVIKCADISNVARPLLISAKWGVVLSREFQETAELHKNLSQGHIIDSIVDDRKHVDLPKSIEDAKNNIPLANGQIFFIDAFALSLFREVTNLFPELKFSNDLILENKLFWEDVLKKQK